MMQNHLLSGSHAIVTGGVGGIGRVIVRRLAELGASVSIADITSVDQEVRRLTAENMSVAGQTVNVTDLNECREFVKSMSKLFGSSTILVNCAGGGARAGFLDTTESTWFTDLNSNLTGTFFMMQSAIPGMLSEGGGSIINISSISGVIGGLPSRGTQGRSGPAYAAAKGGIIALTKWAAREYGREGIRANVIAPGPVLTPADMEGYDYGVEDYPIPRFGTAEDVAGAVAFLASPDSAYITGECLKVTGGIGM